LAPNGVVSPQPSVTARAADFWREKSGAGNRPVALFYSRFHRKKRVLELIDLWLARGPADWLLLLVGIPQEYSPAELERYAVRMSAGDRIRVYSGESLPAPYAIASLFLLPSHNENFGLVIAEAMANAVPVLVTNTTPWSAINAADVGWCVAWEDYGPALGQATSESPTRRAQRGAAAKVWILREFAWRRSAEKLSAFYTSLAKSRP
jgi:glycosyltransferase involved in cell wall biosynthesis